MTRILALVLVCLASAGCSAYNPPYVVPIPNEPETFLERYEFKQGFNGVEIVVGIPVLSWVPIAGPYLSEIVQFRVGVRQDVLVPVMKESIYEHQATLPRRSASPTGLVFVRER